MTTGPTIEGPQEPLGSGHLGADPVAVVEIGSGSVKLLVTDAESLAEVGPDPLRWPVKTRLWSAGARSFDPAGLEATATALGHFASILDDVGGPPLAVVATAVARQVDDASALVELTRRVLGVDLEILSGEREAALGFVGATAGRPLDGARSLLDIGAGSTEVATATGADAPVVTRSLPIGARGLTETWLHGDPPGPDELSSALSVVELHYDDLRREVPQVVPALAAGTVLGVGAIGQIAAVEIGLADPHGQVDGHALVKSDVEEVFRILATECAADRATNPGLLAEHVDDIVGGMCILVEFMRRFGVAEVIVSERNLRHGRAAELLGTEKSNFNAPTS
jgi:exopolyphosphatase / guanosine-5'-triphosphate,3'-diphosphate pyrophosphatase